MTLSGDHPRDDRSADGHEPDRDPILDACLEELLGGRRAPDLSQRIMAAIQARQAQGGLPLAGALSAGDSPAAGTPEATTAVVRRNGLAPIPVGARSQPASRTADSRAANSRTADSRPVSSEDATCSRRLPRWLPVAVAASLLLVVGTYGLSRLRTSGPEETPVARHPSATGAAVNPAGVAASQPDRSTIRPDPLTGQPDALTGQQPANDDPNPSAGTSPADPSPDAIAGQSPAATGASDTSPASEAAPSVDPAATAPSEGLAGVESPDRGTPESVAAADNSTADSSTAGGLAETVAALPPVASNDEEVVAYIDALVRARWKDGDVAPSAPATDAEWCRRVYLDVLGRIPTSVETSRYVGDRSRGKRLVLVNRLVDSDEYLEEYARNWTTVWTNILIGRSGGTEQGTLVNRAGLQQFLRRSFLHNKPYDQMAAELVGAEGSNTPGAEGFNGAVNFLLHNLDENAAPATAKSARIFLGLQVQCTQCHNHPFNEWKQDQFWSLNAFFRQARPQPLEGSSPDMALVRLFDSDFAGEGTNPKEAEIYYELRNGLLKVAYPVFVDGTRIDPSGYVSDVNRRDQLAELVRRSPYLGKAIVNRMWAHFLGYGFTSPVDDMGPHNAPSHPELLERLGRDFAAHGHDLKQLVRWITLSEAYSLSSRVTAKNESDDPARGERPLFSHFYLRQMRPEELYHSLLVATGADAAGGGDYEAVERRKTEWLAQFIIAFGTDEGGESTSFNGTIPQTLMMWNGDLVQKATSGDVGTYLYKVAKSQAQSAAKTNQLFLTALGRRPTNAELAAANELWRLRQGDELAALQDIWWVVLNSNEFIFNH
jgi:hypothetical protein